ncbi:MAG: hypothetical protein ACTHMC_24280 [Pseudobacter sp.]|uniref:hypothetical protein n=1 Tax=Pseudobacter sp. TaxID=2045420 RepID=UPI003F823133
MRSIFIPLFIASVFIGTAAQAQLGKNEKKLEKLYIKYKDTFRLGELYLENGLVNEGKALIEKKMIGGNCSYCREKLDYLLYRSNFPKEKNMEYDRAVGLMGPTAAHFPEAMAIFHSLDADGAYPLASFNLSQQFESGAWATHNYDSAVRYCQRAADGGYPPAMYRLAEYYYYGDGHKYRKCTPAHEGALDYAKAIFWYKEAAAKGHGEAITRLDLLQKATDTAAFDRALQAYRQDDYKTALYWWTIVADGSQSAAACFNVGLIYNTQGIPQYNINRAKDWFDNAGSLGFAKGYFMAGEMVKKMGYGNYAMEYYQKAADMGYQPAVAAKQQIQDYVDAVLRQRQIDALAYNRYVNEQWDKKAAHSSTIVQSNNEKPRTWCSACAGSGRTHTTIYGGARGKDGSTVFGQYSPCSACGGKGSK